jgi:glycosyltransferase involved in cell wall biosynthesis
MADAHDTGISVIIFTLNEEVHLPRCLDALTWCDDVVVVDSLSTDRTEQICRARGVRFYEHVFTGFGDQRNWAFDHVPLRRPWVLILDADEVVTPALRQEIQARTSQAHSGVAAFRLRRRFHMFGRWLKHAGLYPTWVVRLVRVGAVRYINRGHAETQVVHGRTEPLECDLIDHNLKGLDEWFERHNRYSAQEALAELADGARVGRCDALARDPLVRRQCLKSMARRLPMRGAMYFVYSYILRLGFLDGRAGLRYCVIKAMYQQMIAIKKAELRRRGSAATGKASGASSKASLRAAG